MPDEETPTEAPPATEESANPPETAGSQEGIAVTVLMDQGGMFQIKTGAKTLPLIIAILTGGIETVRLMHAATQSQAKVKPFVPAGLEKRS